MPIIIRQVESKGRKGRKAISMDQGMPKTSSNVQKHEDKRKNFTNKVNSNYLELQYEVGFPFTGLCPSGLAAALSHLGTINVNSRGH